MAKNSRSSRNYWLMKSEPDTYGIDHLKNDKKTAWSGVRNFQARNYMRQMAKGDEILFYHSSCAVPGIYGVGKVASAPYPDPTQFDPQSPYFEKRATKERPVWDVVDVGFVKKLKKPVTLADIRATPSLKSLIILRPGSRLSVTPITPAEFSKIVKLGN